MKSLVVFLFLKLIFLLSITANGGDKVRFDNYRLFKVIPKTENQFKVLQNLETEYDFWKPPSHINEQCDIMVSPEELNNFKGLMKINGIFVQEIVPNIQKLIDDTMPNQLTKSGLEWENYHTLEEINQWLDETAAKYPNQVTLFNLTGKSYEGRSIRGLKISYKNDSLGIFIEANVHAREWISSATATWLINELLTSNNETVRFVAENIDWYIVPVLNPDGLEYTHTTDRMWRKTRQPHGNCIGADPNRNFDFLWMKAGASSDPCSQTYAGPHAESEPEIQALVKYFETIPKNKIKIYISFHSYGQMALTPWGHTNKEFPDNYDDMLTVGAGFANAAKRLYGTTYRYGASSVVLRSVSGASKEWAYGVHNIPYTFTLELRDTGTHGFLLPANQILPNAKEVLEGLIGMIDSVPRDKFFN